MSNPALAARSLVEACFYLRVTPCPVCGSGELAIDSEIPNNDNTTVQIVATCRNCAANSAFEFDLRSTPSQPISKVDPISSNAPISTAPDRSRIIDPVQWATLAQLMLDAAEGTPDAGEARWRRIRAGQCIEEALRFYDGENELPDANQLLTDASQSALRDHPQRYARSRLKGIQDKLPVAGVGVRSDGETTRGRDKPWWRFW